MSKKLITTISVVFAIAASLQVGAAKADQVPAQNGGGCNMVWHLSEAGGTNMMTGSAHGTGEGAANMQDIVLARFSDNLCGLAG
jgi:hypothetical protein